MRGGHPLAREGGRERSATTCEGRRRHSTRSGVLFCCAPVRASRLCQSHRHPSRSPTPLSTLALVASYAGPVREPGRAPPAHAGPRGAQICSRRRPAAGPRAPGRPACWRPLAGGRRRPGCSCGARQRRQGPQQRPQLPPRLPERLLVGAGGTQASWQPLGPRPRTSAVGWRLRLALCQPAPCMLA